MTEPVRDYPKEPIHNLTWTEARERIETGWKASRQQWHDDGRNQYVVYALSAQFTTYSRTTGSIVEPFMVMRTSDGKYRAWTPSESDLNALDWAVLP